MLRRDSEDKTQQDQKAKLKSSKSASSSTEPLPADIAETEHYLKQVQTFYQENNIQNKYNTRALDNARDDYLKTQSTWDEISSPLNLLRVHYRNLIKNGLKDDEKDERERDDQIEEISEKIKAYQKARTKHLAKYKTQQTKENPTQEDKENQNLIKEDIEKFTKQIDEQTLLLKKISTPSLGRYLRVFLNPLNHLSALGKVLLLGIETSGLGKIAIFPAIKNMLRFLTLGFLNVKIDLDINLGNMAAIKNAKPTILGSITLGGLRLAQQLLEHHQKKYHAELKKIQIQFEKDKLKLKEDHAPKISELNNNTKAWYSTQLTSIYQTIKRMEKTEPAPQSGWKKYYDKALDITTWTYTSKDDVNASNTSIPVGTNGQLVVKEFGPKSYDYVKTEDFLVRGNLMFDATESLIKASSAFSDEEKKAAALKILNENKEKFKIKILKKCKLDLNIMKGKDTSEKKKYFEEKYIIAKECIQDHLWELAQLIPSTERQTAIKQIREEEKQVIKKRGRPNLIKIGNISPTSTAQDNLMFSAQFTQGKETLPSSLRQPSLEDPIKLSNHVLDLTGHVDNTDPTGTRLAVDFMIDGHSTYSPYQVSDKLMRQKIANAAVKEKIEVATRQLLEANPTSGLGSRDKPLPISLTTLMLFTPLKRPGHLLQGADELDQMKVSRRALEIARHQEQPLELKINGQKVYVNFNLNYMSVPANHWGMKSMITHDVLENTINAEGFFGYCHNVEHFLGNQDPGINQHMSAGDSVSLAALNTELKHKFTKMNAVLASYNPDPQVNNKQAVEEFKTLKKDIKKIEEKQYQIYKKAIDQARQEFKIQAPDPNDPNNLLRQRYQRAQDLFFSGKYKQVEYAFQFHVLYLLTNEQIGRPLESFCKSCEDRTGWLRVSILAQEAFRRANGRDPDLTNPQDRKIYDKVYAYAAHQLSASLDNTQYNSDARGLQMTAAVTNPYIGISMGNKIAKLAKKIFEISPKKKIAKVAGDMFKNLLSRSKPPKLASPQTTFLQPPPSTQNSVENKQALVTKRKDPDETKPNPPQSTTASTGLFSRNNHSPSIPTPPLQEKPPTGLDLIPEGKVDLVKILRDTPVLHNFCKEHHFDYIAEPRPGMVQSNQIRLQARDQEIKDFTIEVTPKCIKSKNLPLEDNNKTKAVRAMVELYMKALKGRKPRSHKIICKDSSLTPQVEALLAQKLVENDIHDARINNKNLKDLKTHWPQVQPLETKNEM